MKTLHALCAAGALGIASVPALAVQYGTPGINGAVPALPVVGSPVSLPALPAALPAPPDLSLNQGTTLTTKDLPAAPVDLPDAPAVPDAPAGLPVSVQSPSMPAPPKKLTVSVTGGTGGKQWIVKPSVVKVDGLPPTPGLPVAVTGQIVPSTGPILPTSGTPSLPSLPAAPSLPAPVQAIVDGIPVPSLPASAPTLPGLPSV